MNRSRGRRGDTDERDNNHHHHHRHHHDCQHIRRDRDGSLGRSRGGGGSTTNHGSRRSYSSGSGSDSRRERSRSRDRDHPTVSTSHKADDSEEEEGEIKECQSLGRRVGKRGSSKSSTRHPGNDSNSATRNGCKRRHDDSCNKDCGDRETVRDHHRQQDSAIDRSGSSYPRDRRDYQRRNSNQNGHQARQPTVPSQYRSRGNYSPPRHGPTVVHHHQSSENRLIQQPTVQSMESYSSVNQHHHQSNGNHRERIRRDFHNNDSDRHVANHSNHLNNSGSFTARGSIRFPLMKDFTTVESVVRTAYEYNGQLSSRDKAAIWTRLSQLLKSDHGEYDHLEHELRTILTRTMNGLNGYESQHISELAGSLAKLIKYAIDGHHEAFKNTLIGQYRKNKSYIFQEIAHAAVPLLPWFTPGSYSNLAYACAAADEVPTFGGRTLFEHIADAINPQHVFTPQETSKILYAYAAVGLVGSSVFTAMEPAVVALLHRCDCYQLASVAWSYTVANVDAPTLFNERFINALLGKMDGFNALGLRQLFRWHIWREEENSKTGLPSAFKEKCYQSFANQDAIVSEFQKDVVWTLHSIGLKPKVKFLPRVRYKLNSVVEVNGKEVGVEAERPSRFIDRKPNGGTMLMHRQIAHVEDIMLVSVLPWKWYGLGQDRNKKRSYLCSLLGMPKERSTNPSNRSIEDDAMIEEESTAPPQPASKTMSRQQTTTASAQGASPSALALSRVEVPALVQSSNTMAVDTANKGERALVATEVSEDRSPFSNMVKPLAGSSKQAQHDKAESNYASCATTLEVGNAYDPSSERAALVEEGINDEDIRQEHLRTQAVLVKSSTAAAQQTTLSSLIATEVVSEDRPSSSNLMSPAHGDAESNYASFASSLLIDIVDSANPCPERAAGVLAALQIQSNNPDQRITVSILKSTKIGRRLAKTLKACREFKEQAGGVHEKEWDEVISMAETLLENYKEAVEQEKSSSSASDRVSIEQPSASMSAATAATTANRDEMLSNIAQQPLKNSNSRPQEKQEDSDASSADDFFSSPLELVPHVGDALAKFDRMVKIQAKIAKTNNEEHKKYLLEVYELLRKFVIAYYEWLDQRSAQIVPRKTNSLSALDGGTYRTIFGKDGESGRPVLVRLAEQATGEASEYGGVTFTTFECVVAISDPKLQPLLDDLKALQPPSLEFHDDKFQKELEKYCRQLIEGGNAACHKGSTREVFEAFTSVPSEELEAIVAVPETYRRESIELLESIIEYKVGLTWGHYRCYVKSLKKSPDLDEEEKAWLEAKLGNLGKVAEEQFNQWSMTKRSFGNSEKLKLFGNALGVESDVRAVEMNDMLREARRVLSSQVMEQFAATGKLPETAAMYIRILVGLIDKKSGNRGWYKPPTSKEAMAQGGVEFLNDVVNESEGEGACPLDKVMVSIENELFKAIKEHCSSDYEKFFPEGSKFMNHRDITGEVAAIVVRTPTGPHFLITHSYHCIMSEKKSLKIRVKACRRLISTMALKWKAGIISEAVFQKERRVIRKFVMDLVGFGTLDNPTGSYRLARNNTSEAGLFRSYVTEGVLATAARIGNGGIGYLESLHARGYLGRARFDALMTAFGVEAGPNFPTPLEIDGPCPGVLEVGDVPASPCPHGNQVTTCAGANTPGWSLTYRFTCVSCAERMRRLEIMNLSINRDAGIELEDEQKERLNNAEGTISKPKRKYVRVAPIDMQAGKNGEKWEKKFKLLVKYKEEHGDCNVPKSYVTKGDEKVKLGNWVACQREGYNNSFGTGTTKEAMDEYRKNKLEGIGFQWTIGRGQYPNAIRHRK